MQTVVYSFVVADLLHYGHLQLLQTAKQLGDLHICGVLTDDAAATYRARPITNFDERVAIISSIRVVDRVMSQDERDPTANLRRIHAEFPDAQLVLVHGNDWKELPGRSFVESIGGRVVQPEYYRRLSDTQIRRQLVQAGGEQPHYESFTEHFRVGSLDVFEPEQRQFVLSTKANTLRSLQPLIKKSRIEPLLTFRANDWAEDRARVLSLVREAFTAGPVVVRSSAINEDTYHRSQAGAFESRVNVAVRGTALERAIDDVVASYGAKGNGNPLNQVLVQPHTKDVRTSGVVFTREPRSGGFYYVINFDDRTGSTESVTSGAESRAVDIAHACPPSRVPKAWRGLLAAVQEIEGIIPATPLDIEFAIDRRGRVVIFQVRPLSVPTPEGIDGAAAGRAVTDARRAFEQAAAPVRHLAGRRAVFSDMAFWNPAEIIGDRPRPLAFSLYRHLITDRVWHEALTPLGYVDVAPAPLMRAFGGKPYIDFRATANALLPDSVSRRLREKLVTHYTRVLESRPEQHDKVEFAIIDNCFYFSLDARLTAMRRAGFSAADTAAYRRGLVDVTRAAFGHLDTIARDVAAAADALARARARAQAVAPSAPPRTRLRAGLALLDDCRDSGTQPFSLMARLAFIGKRMMRSLVERAWITERDYDQFMDGIRTVATEMCEDDDAVTAGRMARSVFLERYGHLRPGTYDITSPRYADEPGYFGLERDRHDRRPARKPFRLAPAVRARVDAALAREGFHLSADDLLRFTRQAIEARERLKFEFTNNFSQAIEMIGAAGGAMGVSRDDLSFLDVGALRRGTGWAAEIETARARHAVQITLSLPPLVFDAADFDVVERPVARPNFVTQRAVRADLITVNGKGVPEGTLEGKVVLIEQADPGFDWLFTQGIAGLVTKYGGVASHMAIRCAEFGLPAAIGCGDVIYRQLSGARGVFLDCAQSQVRPIG